MSDYNHINISLNEVPLQPYLAQILQDAARFHHHLCPRQVLGARIGLAGLKFHNFTVPIRQKKLLVLVETDGCFVSGVQAATGCSVNRRTLRVIDVGRIGVTFVHAKTGRAVRIVPRTDVRPRALNYMGTPQADRRGRYLAMLQAYQTMPEEELITIEPVTLTRPVREIISRPFLRVDCVRCGEEIINEREIIIDGRPHCQPCAGNSYYTPV